MLTPPYTDARETHESILGSLPEIVIVTNIGPNIRGECQLVASYPRPTRIRLVD